jgi:hypothetical protein
VGVVQLENDILSKFKKFVDNLRAYYPFGGFVEAPSENSISSLHQKV